MEDLKKKRSTIKGKLTRASNISDTQLQDEGGISVWEDQLASIEREFETVQSAIEALTPIADGEVDPNEIEREQFESKLFGLRRKARNLRATLISTAPVSIASFVDPSQPVRQVSASSNVKLPRISLPTFAGNWEEWPSFHQLFQKLVGESISFSTIEKFYYLKSNLSGEAALLIADVELNGENYENALDILKLRYDNPRLIITKHLRTIFELPHATMDQNLRSLIDNFNKALRSLAAQGLPTEQWDALLVYLLTTKISQGIRRQWELQIENSTQLPSLKELLTYLEQRAMASEVMSSSAPSKCEHEQQKPQKFLQRKGGDRTFSHVGNSGNTEQPQPKTGCPVCTETHYVFQCNRYHNATLPEREELVKKHRLCGNCLNPRHPTSKCKSSKCKRCNLPHHTSLHKDLVPTATPFVGMSVKQPTIAQLPTALVNVQQQQRRSPVRMIIDSGSQCSFITDALARRLHLKRTRISSVAGRIEGIGGASAASPTFAAEVTISSRHSNFQLTVYAQILPGITNYMPQISENLVAELRRQGVTLADDFSFELPVDILLGSEYWATVMLPNKRQRTDKLPALLDSTFGWLVSGVLPCDQIQQPAVFTCSYTLEQQLRQFWELEDITKINPQKAITADEQACEELYATTTTRDETGRYVVMLPFNERLPELGQSRAIAERQFYQIERRMLRDAPYRDAYQTFMHEYAQLGHMTRVDFESPRHYYLPHHAVTRPDNPSKFRVVFNGSQKTTTGVSLNDTLRIGPSILNDIFLVLVGFRRHAIAITADVEKMYRQVLVHSSHRPFQQILWRFSPNEPLSTYQLNTVTYGLACAPYLAIRSIKQLVADEGSKFPSAAPVLINEDYVDDVLTGAASPEAARQLISELGKLAASGQFTLRKWRSNVPSILAGTTDRAPNPLLNLDDRQYSKVLGMLWNTESDTFEFHANMPMTNGTLTKRQLLSYLSRIFDPLGLLAPVVIVAKCLLQALWLQPIAWDDELSEELRAEYDSFRFAVNEELHQVRIPRYVNYAPTGAFALHGFSDASEKAYGCCVYLHVMMNFGESASHLLCAKTRVAPIQTVSLPRLELCGAVMLARTLTKLAVAYNCPPEQCFAYTDSSIVLAWLSKHPRTWKTFVSNRVAEIETLIPASQWSHVRSASNSADVATRGVTPKELAKLTLWWHPPLPPPTSSYRPSAEPSAVVKEQRNQATACLTVATNTSPLAQLMCAISSHNKTLRVTALVLRAINRFKARNGRSLRDYHELPLTERFAMVKSITVDELTEAHDQLVRITQECAYPKTIQRLRANRPLRRRDPLRALTPFLDASGLLRVRGRIAKADLPEDAIQPILLPPKSNFTVTLIRHLHHSNLHAGARLLVAIIRQRYWITNVRDVVRRITHRCVYCRRVTAAPITQPTGDLPACRITPPPRPFTNTGVDYGGPFSVRFSLARKATTTKAYLALFVCMATKAVHLELVSDLSTDAFFAALERFVARRGLPENIYSDNGTNFVGAVRKMNEIEAFLKAAENDIIRHLAHQHIKWHFIPPYAPNFGGLWEAGMKSAKRLLVSGLQKRLLTFEETYTILTQAEAVLNSRPISSTDSNTLTPGHFLIGAPLKATPITAIADHHLTLAKRWRMVQETSTEFWHLWSQAYITELHNRAKTQAPTPVTIGEIVLIRDESPPLTWPMAKVEALHPGDDNITRVVTLKTENGVTKRAVSKVVRLLIDTP